MANPEMLTDPQVANEIPDRPQIYVADRFRDEDYKIAEPVLEMQREMWNDAFASYYRSLVVKYGDKDIVRNTRLFHILCGSTPLTEDLRLKLDTEAGDFQHFIDTIDERIEKAT